MGSCLFQGKLKEHRHHGSNPYWHQLSLIYDQLEGLEHGYDDKAMREKVVPLCFFVIRGRFPKFSTDEWPIHDHFYHIFINNGTCRQFEMDQK